MMTKEIWKDIPGYENRYQVSNLGQVRSLDRIVQTVRGPRHYQGKILKPGKFCKTGHVSVVLGHGANGKPVHELVALAFLGPRPKSADICHKDGNPKNNCLSNLRYDSRTENIIDVYRQGKRWRKLSVDDVINIRRLLLTHTGADIAQKYRVSATTISRIKLGKIFWWVK